MWHFIYVVVFCFAWTLPVIIQGDKELLKNTYEECFAVIVFSILVYIVNSFKCGKDHSS